MKRHIRVTVDPREDGGVIVYSEDLPGLFLSGQEGTKILAAIEPAVHALLEHRGEPTKDVVIDVSFMMCDCTFEPAEPRT
jgi:hypothetical protein